jgi:hypothetical protein
MMMIIRLFGQLHGLWALSLEVQDVFTSITHVYRIVYRREEEDDPRVGGLWRKTPR